MRRRRSAVLLALALLALGAAGRAPQGIDGEAFSRAARTVLCDCGCPPQSVYDCACGHAEDLRQSMGEMFRSGMSADDVVARWVALYGEKIRVVPTSSGFNLLAWLGPGLFLLVAGGALVVVLRRWKRSSEGASVGAAGVPMPAVSEVYAAEIERQLREEPR